MANGSSVAGLLLAGLLVGGGVAAGGYLVGDSLVKARTVERTVTVKGLSERAVKADLGFWPVRFVAVGNDLAKVRGDLDRAAAAVAQFLTQQGFKAGEFEATELSVQDVFAQAYRSGPVDNRFILTQLVMVRTGDVDRMAKAAKATGDLVRAGVILQADQGPIQPSFVFTKLNDLKPDMLREATARAREAASEFARDAGVKVGGMKTANQGVFEILPAVELENLPESRQIEKKVRIVSTVTYLLAE